MSNKLVNIATATIANGASLSAAVDMRGFDFLAILMPAAWTAAALSFQGSADGTNFGSIFSDTGVEYTFAVDAGYMVVLTSTSRFNGMHQIKIRSGTNATPVNQGAERVLTLIRVAVR